MDLQTLRRRAPTIAVVVFAVLAVLGVVAFLMALRPCRFEVPVGQEIAYDLTTISADLRPDGSRGPETTTTRRLTLVGTAPGEVCQVVAGTDGRPGELALLSLGTDGVAKRLAGPELKQQPVGRAAGYFDLNLMPLPAGTEQAWDAQVSWAVLPQQKAILTAKVKRTRSGAAPEFRLSFAAPIEWPEPRNAGRYVKFRDVVCTYRFNTVSGRYESAELKFVFEQELPEGDPQARRVKAVSVRLNGAGSGRASTDVAALRNRVMGGR
jgi:hypothetical protein